MSKASRPDRAHQAFSVSFEEEAESDIERLFDFRLERAQTVEDLETAQGAVDAIRSACEFHLSANPFSYRKSGTSATRRELIIGFGASGYVAQFEIFPSSGSVLVLAVRHQLEQDYS